MPFECGQCSGPRPRVAAGVPARSCVPASKSKRRSAMGKSRGRGVQLFSAGRGLAATPIASPLLMLSSRDAVYPAGVSTLWASENSRLAPATCDGDA